MTCQRPPNEADKARAALPPVYTCLVFQGQMMVICALKTTEDEFKQMYWKAANRGMRKK